MSHPHFKCRSKSQDWAFYDSRQVQVCLYFETYRGINQGSRILQTFPNFPLCVFLVRTSKWQLSGRKRRGEKEEEEGKRKKKRGGGTGRGEKGSDDLLWDYQKANKASLSSSGYHHHDRCKFLYSDQDAQEYCIYSQFWRIEVSTERHNSIITPSRI